MFTETLSDNTAKALALLGKSGLLKEAYLAGGTACALQIGHRVSIDLDFFTPHTFDPKKMIASLQKVGSFELDEQSLGTILGQLEKVKFSLFVYEYPLILETQDFNGISVASLRDIAAMKIDAISSRGIKRDFIDLYFICQQQLPLREILDFYDRKYGGLASNLIHIQKSLVYFVDAEASHMPQMLKEINWNHVKSFFEREVKALNSSI